MFVHRVGFGLPKFQNDNDGDDDDDDDGVLKTTTEDTFMVKWTYALCTHKRAIFSNVQKMLYWYVYVYIGSKAYLDVNNMLRR